MFHIISQNRKFWLTASIVVVLALVIANLQIGLAQVSAQVIPVTVNFSHLDFGQVFPGEELYKDFTVTYTDDTGQAVPYRIIQKIKPLPGAVPPEGYAGPVSQYCQENQDDFERCYRDLCPYIEKISQEGEEDAEAGAQVSPDDLSDLWYVKLNVPAIIGEVAQDHTGGIVNESGDYGCDIAIDLEPRKSSVCGTKFFDRDQNQARNNGEEGLAGWTINLKAADTEILVEEITVAADSAVSVSSLAGLDNGGAYRIEASGTYFAGGNSAEDIEADAKFSQDDFQALNSLPWTDDVHNYESYGPDLLELMVNGNFVAWGSFSPLHTYSVDFTGDGSPASFQIYDIFYPNNSGSLTVKIFKKISGALRTAVTDSNGEYCFDLVPAGVYTLYETLEPDWTPTVPVDPDHYDVIVSVNDQLIYDFGNFRPTDGGGFRLASSNGSDGGGGHLNRGAFGEAPKPQVLGEAGAPNLVASKRVLADFANPGQAGVGYEIIVANNGNLTAYGVTVDDLLPEGLFFSGTSDKTKTFALGDIAPGGIRSVSYTVDISAEAPDGEYANIATINAAGLDPFSATANLAVRDISVAGAELALSGFSISDLLIIIFLSLMLSFLAYRLRRVAAI